MVDTAQSRAAGAPAPHEASADPPPPPQPDGSPSQTSHCWRECVRRTNDWLKRSFVPVWVLLICVGVLYLGRSIASSVQDDPDGAAALLAFILFLAPAARFAWIGRDLHSAVASPGLQDGPDDRRWYETRVADAVRLQSCALAGALAGMLLLAAEVGTAPLPPWLIVLSITTTGSVLRVRSRARKVATEAVRRVDEVLGEPYWPISDATGRGLDRILRTGIDTGLTFGIPLIPDAQREALVSQLQSRDRTTRREGHAFARRFRSEMERYIDEVA
jgi:hypothetical protein